MTSQQISSHLAGCSVVNAEVCRSRTAFKIGDNCEHWFAGVPNVLKFDDERCRILANDGNPVELFTEATNHFDRFCFRFARMTFKLHWVPVSLSVEHRHQGARKCLTSLNDQTEPLFGADLS